LKPTAGGLIRAGEVHWTAAAISEALSVLLRKALALMLKAQRQDQNGSDPIPHYLGDPGGQLLPGLKGSAREDMPASDEVYDAKSGSLCPTRDYPAGQGLPGRPHGTSNVP
jgi:hypothetical protein